MDGGCFCLKRGSKGGALLRGPVALSVFGFNFSAEWATGAVPNRLEVAVHIDYFTPAARVIFGVAEIERPAVEAALGAG